MTGRSPNKKAWHCPKCKRKVFLPQNSSGGKCVACNTYFVKRLINKERMLKK